MSDFYLEQKILSAPNVVIQELQGESVLLNLNTEEYFGLDDVGTRMWHALTEVESIQAAMLRLQVEYDVPSSQLKLDVSNLVSELLANGLVEISAP